jgi:hypothetical protein
MHWRVMPGKLYIIDALSMELYCMQETAVRETKGVLERGSTAHTVNGRKQQYYYYTLGIIIYRNFQVEISNHQITKEDFTTHAHTTSLQH